MVAYLRLLSQYKLSGTIIHMQRFLTPKWLITLGAIVLVLIIGGVSFALLRGGHDSDIVSSSSQQPGSEFKNWLKPTSEIKVGNYRYQSPCQVLPMASVQKIYGDFGDDAFYQESMLDINTNDTNHPQDTQCGYSYGFGNDPSIYLLSHQYANDDYKSIATSSHIFPEDLSQAMTDYNNKLGNTSDADAKALLATLNSSQKRYKSALEADVFDDNVRKSLNLDGIILPNTFLSSDGEYKFTAFYGNVVYELDYKAAKGFAKPSLERAFARANRTFAVIAANAKNHSLDQSPAPTVFGDTNKRDGTTILEPCAVLTNDVFASLTGKTVNQPTSRQSTPRSVTKVTKKGNLPSNNCERTAATDTDKLYLGIDLAYGSKAEIDSLTHDNEAFGVVRTLQTNADWAVKTNNPVDPSMPVYVFRVGNYHGDLTYYTMHSGGLEDDITDTPVSDDQFIAAINALAPRIREQSKQ